MLFGRKYFPRIIEYSVISVKKSAWMQCRLSADRRVSPVISTPQWSCIYRVKCMYWTLVVAIFDAGDMTLWMERQTCIKSVSIAISCSIHRCITFSAHSLSVSLHFSRARCFLIFFSLFKWKKCYTHTFSVYRHRHHHGQLSLSLSPLAMLLLLLRLLSSSSSSKSC